VRGWVPEAEKHEGKFYGTIYKERTKGIFYNQRARGPRNLANCCNTIGGATERRDEWPQVTPLLLSRFLEAWPNLAKFVAFSSCHIAPGIHADEELNFE
jgi:hypothetical protein